MKTLVQKITPFLWFDKEAGEAAKFYTSPFPNSKILSLEKYSDTPSGTVEVYTIEISGHRFTLMSAGPQFKFNEAISFVVNCRNQDEVDYYWDKLNADGGEESMCGWLKDKFGLSWQVVSSRFNELVADEDKEKSNRVMQAMLKMKKFNIAELEKAYNGE